MTNPEKCICGEMLKEECPGEWEPGCDLGNNEKYVVVVEVTYKDVLRKLNELNNGLVDGAA